MEDLSGIIQKVFDQKTGHKDTPTTWIPCSQTNPSKLTLHYFNNGEWVKTSWVKCVSWPERFPAAGKCA